MILSVAAKDGNIYAAHATTERSWWELDRVPTNLQSIPPGDGSVP